MFSKILNIAIHFGIRCFLLINIVYILDKENNGHVYKLAALYISFLVIILNINHKNRNKILTQSFFIVILGTFVYLLRDAHFVIKLFVELSLSIFLTELLITTLNLQEIVKLLKYSFHGSFDDFEFQKFFKKKILK